MLIVLHNLAHNVVPFMENEKCFDPSNAEFFINNVLAHPILGSISYLGWLGVPIFFFLSGYGLSKKYGKEIPNPLEFIKIHYLKLLLLAGPCILIDNIIRGSSFFQILGQLTFLNGFFGYDEIYPVAFWYLRVAFEFYILYALILRHIPAKWFLGLSLVIVCSFVFISGRVVETMKFHSIGWLLDFSLGVFIAKDGKWLKRIENVYCSLLFLVLLVFSSIYEYAWLFSTTLAVLFFLSIKRHITNKLVLFLGSISAFLYVVHPIVRNRWTHLPLDYMNGNVIYIFLSICAYLGVCVLAAYLYGLYYKKVISLLKGSFLMK